MIQNWTGYEGRFAGAWRLDSFLGDRDGKGFFMTTNPADSSQALLEIIPAGEDNAGIVRGSWGLARRFTHDHLMRVYETGETILDAVPAYYAVQQLPDDDVSEMLAARPLETSEVRSMLSAAASALDHLHKLDLKHGAVIPSNVLLVGKTFKLSADTIASADQAGRESDIRQLGQTLIQAVTRKDEPNAAGQLPSPFREIAAGCLGAGVRDWTPARILDALSGKRAETPAGNASRLRMPVAAAAALVIVASLGYWFTRKPAQPEPPPPPKKVQEPVAAAPVAATFQKPSPLTPVRSRPPEHQADRQRGMPGAKSSGWAVISATYNSFSGAQHRADQIGKSNPQLRTHVYPPEGKGQTYYVVLGSGLSQAQAQELRDRARQLGAPRDTYITKLSEN